MIVDYMLLEMECQCRHDAYHAKNPEPQMNNQSQIKNRKWMYVLPPEGLVGGQNYEHQEEMISTSLSEGEVIVEAAYISVDPYMRINQSKRPTYNPEPHAVNTVQTAGVVGRVIHSAAPAIKTGDWVEGMLGWQTHAKVHHSMLRKLDPTLAPVSTALGVLGMPGRTAWFGLTESGKPHAGEVVVVSGAAGAVGSLVAQFAKRHGAKVLGIAGGAEKCRWLTETLRLDWALDYKLFDNAQKMSDVIKEMTGGVDVYFDNVGGMATDAIMPIINRRARIVICGQISQYSGGLDEPELGPRFLHHMLYQRATIQGMLARDYIHRMDEMIRVVAPWVQSGEIIFEETIVDGFEQLPTALNSLFTGEHRGKLLVKV
jgi:NADPH-dependent curcumin reductase CurA